ncbi:hypothetical protein [Sphingobium yanoikuyae]|uniref:hypothetical protein n=1 Tax=Sphingobium yanoikuyae TaxID=13690 RepID=UPI0026ED5BBB|nr:hypothetical protein [Sphingobium yanoikuyae]
MTSNPNIGQEQADALAKALCLLDTFAGEGIGHTYGNGTTIDADTTVIELCAAFGMELEAGWWRALADQLASTPTPAQVEPVDRTEHAFRTGYEAGFEDAGGKGDYSPDTAWEAYP